MASNKIMLCSFFVTSFIIGLHAPLTIGTDTFEGSPKEDPPRRPLYYSHDAREGARPAIIEDDENKVVTFVYPPTDPTTTHDPPADVWKITSDPGAEVTRKKKPWELDILGFFPIVPREPRSTSTSSTTEATSSSSTTTSTTTTSTTSSTTTSTSTSPPPTAVGGLPIAAAARMGPNAGVAGNPGLLMNGQNGLQQGQQQTLGPAGMLGPAGAMGPAGLGGCARRPGCSRCRMRQRMRNMDDDEGEGRNDDDDDNDDREDRRTTAEEATTFRPRRIPTAEPSEVEPNTADSPETKRKVMCPRRINNRLSFDSEIPTTESLDVTKKKVGCPFRRKPDLEDNVEPSTAESKSEVERKKFCILRKQGLV